MFLLTQENLLYLLHKFLLSLPEPDTAGDYFLIYWIWDYKINICYIKFIFAINLNF